jgi:hypothetical protein
MDNIPANNVPELLADNNDTNPDALELIHGLRASGPPRVFQIPGLHQCVSRMTLLQKI